MPSGGVRGHVRLMGMGQRMFVAVEPPQRVRDHLAEFLEPRAGLRWSAPEQWHVTLAFLAAVPEHVVDELVERLSAAAARQARFAVRIGGAGAFPHAGRSVVLWLAVTPVAGGDVDGGPVDRPLHRLAAGARAAANAAGAAADGRAFVPHVTLARPRPPIEATRWLRVLDTYRGPEWPVEQVELVASHLREGPARRPRYETVATLPLAGAAGG